MHKNKTNENSEPFARHVLAKALLDSSLIRQINKIECYEKK